MHDLTFRFADGDVQGEGRDCIGPFSFHGNYDETGAISLVKKYHGRHEVIYRGLPDGEGLIFGQWSIGSIWSGTFALAPLVVPGPPDAPIHEIRPLG